MVLTVVDTQTDRDAAGFLGKQKTDSRIESSAVKNNRRSQSRPVPNRKRLGPTRQTLGGSAVLGVREAAAALDCGSHESLQHGFPCHKTTNLIFDRRLNSPRRKG